MISQDPHRADFIADPYAFYAERHRETHRFQWEQYGFWCFGGWDDVHALFRDRRFGRRGCVPPFSERIERWYETERFSLLALDPPEHTEMRALVNRAFLSRRVERLRPRIEVLAGELIDTLIEVRGVDGPVDLLPTYASLLPVIVIAELIGLPADKAPDLLDWSNRMVQMYMHGADENTERDADAAAAAFSDYLATELAARRIDPRDDLLTHMLGAEIDGRRLCESEVIATTILLLNAGHEATVHTTGNAIRTILQSGLDPARLFADDASVAAVVEECLRFDPPLHLFTRFALEDVEIDGIGVAAGDQVGLLLGAANRDPTRFDNPDRFDPFRTDGGNVSFGAGIHFCIGAPLARIELQTSLRLLFSRLPGLRLATAPVNRDIYHFRGLSSIDVEWD